MYTDLFLTNSSQDPEKKPSIESRMDRVEQNVAMLKDSMQEIKELLREKRKSDAIAAQQNFIPVSSDDNSKPPAHKKRYFSEGKEEEKKEQPLAAAEDKSTQVAPQEEVIPEKVIEHISYYGRDLSLANINKQYHSLVKDVKYLKSPIRFRYFMEPPKGGDIVGIVLGVRIVHK
jgi:hypothetical protein